jgi:hypothetical protein
MVDNQSDSDWNIVVVEQLDGLKDAVFVNLKIRLE